MAFFKIGNIDYSAYVSSLKVSKSVKYKSQESASGNTVCDYINAKRTITVGIIPLDDTTMKNLTIALDAFNVKLSFRNPNTNLLEANVDCIIPSTEIEYYTIQLNNVRYKAMNLTFTEL